MVLGALIFVSYLNLLYKQTARADCRGGWGLQVLVIPLQTSNNIFKKLGHHHVLLTSVNVVVIFCDIYVSDYGACVNSVYDNSQYLEGIHERLLFSLDFMNTCCILTQLYLTAIKYFLHSSKFDKYCWYTVSFETNSTDSLLSKKTEALDFIVKISKFKLDTGIFVL